MRIEYLQRTEKSSFSKTGLDSQLHYFRLAMQNFFSPEEKLFRNKYKLNFLLEHFGLTITLVFDFLPQLIDQR